MTKRSASRYPGIRSFERNEQGLFFGRQRETQALFEAVKVKPLTVLFSKSGIGKTSLLNAGLSPLLEQNGFLPIVIRLQDTSISPIETVQKVLAEYLDEDKLRQFGHAPYSLWEYVRACAFGQSSVADAEQPVPNVPVLLFDQFEELFTHDKQQREALTLALADLLNERLPEEVRRQLRNFPREQRSNELLEWYNPLKIKIVFAIRADRMSDLDALKYHIPTVLHDRFHLKPLSHENAREAIVKPAALRTSDFALTTSDFEYAPAAVQEMLDALDNEQGEIESFQLQLLCSYLENKVTREGQVITSADFGGKAGVATILNDYYEREIGALNPAEQLAARRFIEEGLIVNGRRVGLPEGTEQSRFGIGPELLGKLLNSRLLRSEMIHLGKIYELSHDTLIEPILRSYEKRHAEEELRRAEQLLAEERRLLAETQRKRARARLFAIAGFALFGLALLGGGFAWYNFQQAQIAQKRAEVTALAAKAWNIYRDDQTLAFRIAQFAYESDTSNAEALQTVQKIVNEPTTAYYQSIFKQHSFEVQCLAFSPDGQRVASGSLDSEVFVWDHSGKVYQHYSHGKKGAATNNRQSGSVKSVQFIQNGRQLLSADVTGEVIIWDLTADTLLRSFKTRPFLYDMALSPDERFIVTCGRDSTAQTWDLTGKLLRTFKGHNGLLTSVAFSPDNQLIATGAADRTARIWNMNGSCKQVIQLPDVGVVNDVHFSPDSRTLALACSDNTARLFDREGHPLNTLSGHTAEVSKVLFSPDGRYLLTTSFDHTAKLWSISGEEVLRLVGHSERLSAAAFSPDGNWLATGGFDFQAKLWNLAFNLHNKFNRHTNFVSRVKVAPDGSYLVSGSRDFTLKKWNFAGDLLANMEGHKNNILSLEISPDGKTFASASNDKDIRLWTAEGRPLHTFTYNGADILKVVFTIDNQHLISTNSIGEITVYNAADGQVERKWKASSGKPVQALVLSADGQRLYTGSGNTLRAWNLQGDSLWSAAVGARINAVAVSPDGKSILIAAKQLPIKIWDASGQLRKDCYGHQAENYFVDWSPDGEKFVSCSWDQTAKIWDKNGNCLQTLAHPDGVYSSDFTPDSRQVLTACRDKIIRIWEAQTGKMVNTIGLRTDVRPFFESPYIADLDAIIFDWEKYGITTALATKIYSNKPGNLIRHGLQVKEKAVTALGDYQGCSRYLSEAERILLNARQLDTATPPTANYDSLIAEVYSLRTNLLLLNKDFEQMVSTARAGMAFKPLDFLKVYEVNGLLLGGKFEEALQKARAIKAEKVHISFYTDMTFGEVFNEELVFYEEQYGIQCADKERFAEQLK